MPEILGYHQYNVNGNYNITVNVYRGGRWGPDILHRRDVPPGNHVELDVTDASSSALAFPGHDPTDIIASGLTVQAVSLAAYSGAVGTFQCSRINASAGDFLAQIDWGDGETGSGTVNSTGQGPSKSTGSTPTAIPAVTRFRSLSWIRPTS